MVVVPAGSFTMGSPEDEPERRSNEDPQHEVRIPRDFAVGRHAVTPGQFAAFVKATGHKAEGAYIWKGDKYEFDPNGSWRNPGFTQDDSHPVVCVNWNDADQYVKWLKTVTGKPYRLLSEAEWEYCCRAGTGTPFYQFLLWLLPTVDRFPKAHKFVFGDRILNIALDILETTHGGPAASGPARSSRACAPGSRMRRTDNTWRLRHAIFRGRRFDPALRLQKPGRPPVAGSSAAALGTTIPGTAARLAVTGTPPTTGTTTLAFGSGARFSARAVAITVATGEH
jgi:hypothetical protein